MNTKQNSHSLFSHIRYFNKTFNIHNCIAEICQKQSTGTTNLMYLPRKYRENLSILHLPISFGSLVGCSFGNFPQQNGKFFFNNQSSMVVFRSEEDDWFVLESADGGAFPFSIRQWHGEKPTLVPLTSSMTSQLCVTGVARENESLFLG